MARSEKVQSSKHIKPRGGREAIANRPEGGKKSNKHIRTLGGNKADTKDMDTALLGTTNTDVIASNYCVVSVSNLLHTL